jgi:hypothetical protein
MYSFDDEYIKICQLYSKNKLYINWYAETRYISRFEFKQAVELILNTVLDLAPEYVLIDTSEYNYPVIVEERMLDMRTVLTNTSSIKSIGLIYCDHCYGILAVKLFLKLISSGIDLTLFREKYDGLNWLLKNK